MKCACGSGDQYDACCGVYHSAKQVASTPLQLMRSRYCAYTLADIPYIEQTQAEQAANNFDPMAARIWADSVDWCGLEVIESPPVVMGQTTGSVTFKANYVQAGKHCCIYERSTFRLVQGKWFYVSGDHLD